MVLYMILFMYAIFKFGHLTTKNNPNLTAFLKVDELFGKTLNLNENNFRFAFTIESYEKPYKQKNDPAYVKYITRVYGKSKGKYY